MTNRDNILNELNELGSNLVTASSSNVYHVPGGYFEGLVTEILNRIRAMENDSGEVESFPFVGKAGKTTPYQVPAGYFDGLEHRLMKAVLRQDTQETPEEELESLSPLLSGLKKQMPYSVPAGYFETLIPANAEDNKAPAKVVSMTSRKWFRYAAAAIVIGIVTISAFLFIGKESVDPNTKSYAWVKKNMKNVTTESLDSFITITEKEAPIIASATTPGNEIKEMVKNISDEELETFLNDVENAEPDSDEDVILN
jgi:hypothetical protein